MEPLVALGLVAAGSVGGVMNALAGGGTVATFPALVLVGVPPTVANATSTVALLPGALSSLAGYWPEVRSHRRWLLTLLLPSLLGGAVGSLTLLATPEHLFSRLAPALLLFATLLFAVQSRRAAQSNRRPEGDDSTPLPHRGWRVASIAQLLVAIYGGFFGAGIGILMLAILGSLGLENIHAMNGLKNFFGACINGVAAAIFIVSGAVRWSYALPVLLGALAGGYLGARFGRYVGRQRARQAVVGIGLLVTLILIWNQI